MIKTFNIAQTRNEKKVFKIIALQLEILQHAFGKKKLHTRHEISHIRVQIPQVPPPMTSYDKDIPFSTTCEISGT